MTATAKVTATPAAPVKPATYTEAQIITVTDKGAVNPKRGASAKRYAAYATGMTVAAYLDACLAIQPDEPRYRWRADLAWDVKRGFITVA